MAAHYPSFRAACYPPKPANASPNIQAHLMRIAPSGQMFGGPVAQGYNPCIMYKRGTTWAVARSAFYYTEDLARGELALGALASGLYAALVSYCVGLLPRKIFLLSVLVLIIVYALFIVIAFIYNMLWWKHLPRRLGKKQKKWITEYLETYRDDVRRVHISIYHHPEADKAKEARDYADDIRTAIETAGWIVETDSEDSLSETEYCSGLSVYGAGIKSEKGPPSRQVIAAALRGGKVKFWYDYQNPMPETTIVVGHLEACSCSECITLHHFRLGGFRL